MKLGTAGRFLAGPFIASGREDIAIAVTLDRAGNAYVVGKMTGSSILISTLIGPSGSAHPPPGASYGFFPIVELPGVCVGCGLGVGCEAAPPLFVLGRFACPGGVPCGFACPAPEATPLPELFPPEG